MTLGAGAQTSFSCSQARGSEGAQGASGGTVSGGRSVPKRADRRSLWFILLRRLGCDNQAGRRNPTTTQTLF